MDQGAWPHYVDYALEMIGYSEEDAAAYVAAFLQRWGDIRTATLAKVVHKGVGDDRLFAIFALGEQPSVRTRKLLLPVLQSSFPLERWGSAICLGKMGDQASLPILCLMLTEFLPTSFAAYQEYQRDEQHLRLDALRSYVPAVLAGMKEPKAVPSLRQAVLQVDQLLHVVASEGNQLHRLERPAYDFEQDMLANYQESIVFALGRLQALGALTGLAIGENLTPSHLAVGLLRQIGEPTVNANHTAATYRSDVHRLDIWRIYLAAGYLYNHFVLPDALLRWDQVPEFQIEVVRMLQQCFGLSSSELEQSLSAFEGARLSKLAAWYHVYR